MFRNNSKIILVGLFFGAMAWMADVMIDQFFHPHEPFLNLFLFDRSTHEFYERLILMIFVTVSIVVVPFKTVALHQKTREALWEGERLLKNIMDSIQEGLIIKDPDFNIVRINPVVARWFDFAMPLVGRKCYEALRGRDSPCPDCPTHKAIESGQPAHAVLPKPGPGGQEVGWLDLHSYPLVDAATGQINGVVEFMRDITARQQAEDALRESENRYRMLVNNIPAVVFKGYLDWTVEFVDHKIDELTGYNRDEFNSHRLKWRDLVLPEDLEGAQQLFLQALKTTKSYVREYRIRHKAGRLIWIQARGQMICQESGKVEYINGVFFDITEQKQVEEALADSERRYRLLAVTDVIWTMDLKARLTFVSPAIKWLTGYDAREFLEFTLDQMLTPASLEIAKEKLNELALKEEYRDPARAITKELEFLRHDGSTIWAEVKASLLLDDQGRPLGFLGVTRDISARRKLEAQLQQSQKMEVVGRLAGGVAHDFNNLLTAILGYTELSLAGLDARDPIYQDVLEIKKAGEQASLLTRQLLAFSRRQVMQPKSLQLNLIIENLAKMLKRIIGEDIGLEISYGADLGRVLADPGQIEQVILNLTVNARDAMPQGGKLTIRTANVELDDAYAQAHAQVQPGPYVLLAVTDNGCGMDAATRDHIFEPFFTTKEVGKGTGLGLSTVYGIVHQSDGHIWVYSEPGQGSAFKIYLPRVTAEAESTLPGLDADATLGGHETILLVEDDEGVRGIAGRILQQSGYQVLPARDGNEALKICRQYREAIHLVLTDLVIPGINGRDLVLGLASLRPGIKVAFMSGYAEEDIIDHEVLGPGLVFIQKPFEARLLTRKLRELLNAS